jgi:predicted DNA-binding protein with PD1-like motif
MQTYGLRLLPGQDLRESLREFARHHQLEAGVILTAIGSFEQAALRFAARSQSSLIPGPLELISLHGTLSHHGLHIHGTVADEYGQLTAGHVSTGCIIRTTAEIAIAQLSHLSFQRLHDPQTGYLELTVKSLRSLEKP